MNEQKKKISPSGVLKHNLKTFKRYNTLYPRDLYFKNLPKSYLHTEVNNTPINSDGISERCVTSMPDDYIDYGLSNQIRTEFQNIDCREINYIGRGVDLDYESNDQGTENVINDHPMSDTENDDVDNAKSDDGDNVESDDDSNNCRDFEDDTEDEETDNESTNDICVQTNMVNIPFRKTQNFSPKDNLLSTLAVSIKNNWTYQSTLDALSIVNDACGITCLPTTKSGLWNTIQLNDKAIIHHMYCINCRMHLGVGRIPTKECKCKLCGPTKDKSHVNEFLEMSLYLQIMDLLKLPGMQKHLQYRFTRVKQNRNNIEDIFDGFEYKRLCKPGKFLSNPNNFSFTFFTDGCAVADSSNASAWPIFVQINELPPHLRKKHMLLAGIYVDDQQPSMNNFLLPFVKQVKMLHDVGVTWKATEGVEIVSKFCAVIGCFDSPARAKVLNMKQYNGEFGCSSCYAFGKQITGKRVYPAEQCFKKLRTDTEIRNNMDAAYKKKSVINGVKGPSPLLLLKEFNMQKGVPSEKMHAACLGAIKHHTTLLMSTGRKNSKKTKRQNSQNTPLKKRRQKLPPYYIGNKIKLIDKRLLAIRPHNRRSRLPRSISKCKLWKASEWRNWLDYLNVCLEGILPEKYLEHFGLLAQAFHILNSDSISISELDEAKDLLSTYVKNFQKYFGVENMTSNIHLLTHFVESVENFGPLFAYSAFPFESWNRKIMSKVTSPQSRCMQISRRFFISKFIIHQAYDTSLLLKTQQKIQKLFNIPKEIEIIPNRLNLKGSMDNRSPSLTEARALEAHSYNPVHVEYFKKASINGVFYKCDGKTKTKFCNSIVYCKEVGFGKIMNFVSFEYNNQWKSGIFVEKLVQLNILKKVRYICQVQPSEEIVFVESNNILGPGMTIVQDEKVYAFKLANYWATD